MDATHEVVSIWSLIHELKNLDCLGLGTGTNQKNGYFSHFMRSLKP